MTSELRRLHERCGGGADDPLSLPGLALLIRQAARLDMALSTTVLVADGDRNISYWVRALPRDDAVELELYQWAGATGGHDRFDGSPARDRDFLRASADWTWEADEAWRFTALSVTASAALERPAPLLIGQPMSLVMRLRNDQGEANDFEGVVGAVDWTRGCIAETIGREPRYFRLVARNDRQRACWVGSAVEIPAEIANEAVRLSDAGEVSADTPGGGPAGTDILRTPIEQIAQYAKEIQSQSFGHLKSVYAGYGGDIAAAARHLRTLIDDVFDVAAIDSGTVALTIDNIDLTALAEEARAIVSQRAAASGSRIVWRIAPRSVIVRGDGGRALQILINLMQNAVKFAGAAGPIQLSLEVDDGNARLVVDDQGEGISPGDADRIFTKFERLSPHVEGSGLGLYISRAFARAMGGDITLSRSPEGGARFTLVLARA